MYLAMRITMYAGRPNWSRIPPMHVEDACGHCGNKKEVCLFGVKGPDRVIQAVRSAVPSKYAVTDTFRIN